MRTEAEIRTIRDQARRIVDVCRTAGMDETDADMAYVAATESILTWALGEDEQ